MSNPTPPFRRIAVIGSSGAGKSTLSGALGRATGLPVVHLDKEFWLPNWTEPDRVVWAARLADLRERPDWIIDGHYGGSLRPRLDRADLAIFLDLPTRVCLWRVVRRITTSYGRVRPDMGAGCPEQVNVGFLKFVATFRAKQRPRVVAALDATGVRVVWLRTRREQALFAATLAQTGLAAAVEDAPAWPR